MNSPVEHRTPAGAVLGPGHLGELGPDAREDLGVLVEPGGQQQVFDVVGGGQAPARFLELRPVLGEERRGPQVDPPSVRDVRDELVIHRHDGVRRSACRTSFTTATAAAGSVRKNTS